MHIFSLACQALVSIRNGSALEGITQRQCSNNNKTHTQQTPDQHTTSYILSYYVQRNVGNLIAKHSVPPLCQLNQSNGQHQQ